MSFSTADLAEIKWSLIACLLALLGAYALFGYSSSFAQAAQQQLEQARHQQADTRKLLASAQSDLENMAAYQKEFDALIGRKIIGNEPRLDWIEGLESMRTQRLVPEFNYTIGPQKPYVPNPPLDGGNFTSNLSTMNLQVKLLHEEQLLRLLDAINTRLPGWFLLDHCSLTRNTAEEPGSVPLAADCVGGWFTLKYRSAP